MKDDSSFRDMVRIFTNQVMNGPPPTYAEEVRYLRALSPPLPWWAWLRRRRYTAPAAPRAAAPKTYRVARYDGGDARSLAPVILRGPRLLTDAEIDAHLGQWSSR